MRSCFTGRRRLRQSDVAQQRISAPSEILVGNGRLIFSNPVPRAPSNQFLSGYEAGGILPPAVPVQAELCLKWRGEKIKLGGK